MAEIAEFPVDGGGVLRVQAVDEWLDGGDELVPASGIPEKVQHVTESLNAAIGSVTPALAVITKQLRKLSPAELTVEFGMVLSGEYGIVVAKGKGEVHFTVTLAWKKADGAAETVDAHEAEAEDDDGDEAEAEVILAVVDGGDAGSGPDGGG